MQLNEKQPSKTREKIWAQSNGPIFIYGHLSRYSSPVGGMARQGAVMRIVPIPRKSIENSLQKHVKKFERDPTVGSLDTDLLSRYSNDDDV